MGPIVSNVCDKGNVPSRQISPLVVFRPVMPLREEGVRTEPPVSVPIAHGARPAATATPEPLDEPPGIRCSVMSQGFQGVPINGLVPQPPNANSTICVLPKITAPAASSFFTISAVTVLCRCSHCREPTVVVVPSISHRSLT